MSASPIEPLTSILPTFIIEPVSSAATPANTAIDHASKAISVDGSVVELSDTALQHNVEQLSLQNQINILKNAQDNAVKHLELISVPSTINPHPDINEQQFVTTLTDAQALLNAELQTTLSSEALISAIAAEHLNSATFENNLIQNSTVSPNVIPAQIGSTTIANNTSATTQINMNNQPAAALVSPHSLNDATSMINNPAIAAAIAAYHLSDGLIIDRGNKTPEKLKEEEVSVKDITLLDPINKIKDDDAEQQAKREAPWIWKRVLKIKNKLMWAAPKKDLQK
ncbi:hypothetical protein [Undibacterium sp. SXout20W]|uniref:hypothetical protein n=1 Tax=Undibacterium sp. SXout20W TaxID=3413051 RepID=UPI003BF0E501